MSIDQITSIEKSPAHLLTGFPPRGAASYPPPERAGGVADP